MSLAVTVGIELIFITYLLLVCILILGWLKATGSQQSVGNISNPARGNAVLSVVIAVRNEVRHLPRLISDLRLQSVTDMEIIVVDDHSEDDTVAAAIAATDGDERFHFAVSSGSGKKAALTTGVTLAKGTIVLTTDADCRVGPNWVATMTQSFSDPTTMMVFASVRISSSKLFDHMQSLEFATLIGAGAATATFNLPTMCNGANLSYRKSAFVSVGGYNDNLQIPSGDDEFLMRKIKQKYPNSVRFCGAQEATVTTSPMPGFVAFFDQRIRWAGKWRRSGNLTSTLLALSIFIFHLTVIALPWLLLSGVVAWRVVAITILSKVVVEFVYTRILQKRLRIRWSWPAFFMLQIVYSYYVVIVAVCAQFVGFEWKGRKLKPVMAEGY